MKRAETINKQISNPLFMVFLGYVLQEGKWNYQGDPNRMGPLGFSIPGSAVRFEYDWDWIMRLWQQIHMTNNAVLICLRGDTIDGRTYYVLEITISLADEIGPPNRVFLSEDHGMYSVLHRGFYDYITWWNQQQKTT